MIHVQVSFLNEAWTESGDGLYNCALESFKYGQNPVHILAHGYEGEGESAAQK